MSSFKAGQVAQVGSQRFRTNHKISFSFRAEERVRKAYLLNLSETGMFIRCEPTPAPGTELSFELFATKESRSMHGQAKVVWVRKRKEGHDRPQGMGVAITHMEPGSRQWLLSSVGQGLSAASGWSETEQLPSVADDGLAEPLDYGMTPLDSGLGGAAVVGASTPASSAAMPSAVSTAAASATAGTYYNSSKGSRGKGFDVLAIGALLLLIGVAASLYYLRGSGSPAAASSTGMASDGDPSNPLDSDGLVVNTAFSEAVSSEAASAEYAPSEEAESPPLGVVAGTNANTSIVPSVAAVPAAAPALAAPRPAADLALLAPAVEAWAEAWSEQDAEGYLNSYGEAFKPPGGMRRGRWESRRRERIAKPQFIRVSLSLMEVEALGEGRARATFHQNYRSDRMGDTVRKALDMTWEEERWKISGETVLAKIK